MIQWAVNNGWSFQTLASAFGGRMMSILIPDNTTCCRQFI
ncbi:hypothetical protein JOH48_002791 [Bradyrhizobium elkanii]|nr:hypothetical protein [Bradyrhizobium elkanii]